MLALDAQSAFDRCLRQILICELHKAGLPGAALQFIDNRLASRTTVYEWDGVLMGPAEDQTGFEQGGINSSDYYKLYNNEQLNSAQESSLGVDIGSSVVSAVGQADDVILLSGSLDDLRLLVRLTEKYCAKFRVKLEPGKTKLMVFNKPNNQFVVDHAKLTNSITISGQPIKFATEAEHVGVIRHTTGNLPNIVNRIAKHKKVVGSVLSAGMARRHRANIAASLKVHQMYCTPVLFSGLASLVLSRAEIKIVDNHYQSTLRNAQKLHEKTPRSIIYFLAGSLPGEAILHQKQLGLFSMICHLPGDPLHLHAQYVLTSASPSANSWFQQILSLCLMYQLPHPLTLLSNPIKKQRFKKLVKLKITDY